MKQWYEDHQLEEMLTSEAEIFQSHWDSWQSLLLSPPHPGTVVLCHRCWDTACAGVTLSFWPIFPCGSAPILLHAPWQIVWAFLSPELSTMGTCPQGSLIVPSKFPGLFWKTAARLQKQITALQASASKVTPASRPLNSFKGEWVRVWGFINRMWLTSIISHQVSSNLLALRSLVWPGYQ